MDLKEHFKAELVDGTIRLIPRRFGGMIAVIGSTVKTNSPPDDIGGNAMNSLIIYPADGEEGLIAFCFHIVSGPESKKGRMRSIYCAFIRVTVRDGKPWLDLENEWFPTERIASLTPGEIHVKIGNETYRNVTNLFDEEYREPGSAIGVVNGGNLLCRYAFGLAYAEEIVSQASRSSNLASIATKAAEENERLREDFHDCYRLVWDINWKLQNSRMLRWLLGANLSTRIKSRAETH